VVQMARPLPERDVHALFDVVVVFLGQLEAGEATPELTTRMIRRLAGNGFLATDASEGELAAVVGDLCQRLHYAMGAHDTLPEPSLRETTYTLVLPTEKAARACDGEVTTLGALDSSVSVGDHGWHLLATFPDVAPDSTFRDRVVQLEALARRHGGRYAGAHR
jgi:hypothetical protein